MARSISQIRDLLIQGLKDRAALVGITINPTNWSEHDYKLLLLDTVATAGGINEQIHDSAILDIEDNIKVIAPQTPQWFKNLMLNMFEYNSVTVPIIQFDALTFTPYYINPNPANRIIKYCSVVPGVFGTTLIKIASETASLPSQITGLPLSAAQTFINTLAIPGINYVVDSRNSDKLFMQLDVYYNGLYSAIIEANVIAAIENYLKSIPFDGYVSLSFLKLAILNVSGVTDCVINNMQARADVTSVGAGTNLVLNNLEVQRNFSTIAGYIVLEDTAGANWRLSDFRVGSAGIKNLNLIPS
jgi:hypothetical protein